jgi:HD-GYP domain-containing protein (c-di-GMP phosphodiesterase class II)
MNELSKLTNFLIDRFEEDDLVNTITMVQTKNIDNNKENIYQLVNIDYLQSEVLEDTIIARFLITAVQQRDIKPKKLDSKLRLDINLIDNWNETHSVITRFINRFMSNNFEYNIDLFSSSTTTVLQDWNKNGLDGHQITIELSIPNLGSGC